MLSFWSEKPEDRPNFSSIVDTLTSYMIATADYLDLTAVEGKKSTPLIKECPAGDYSVASPIRKDHLEAGPEHGLTRVASEPNNYTMMAASNSQPE